MTKEEKLYNYLLPVLESKEKEFKILGKIYITKSDIWFYLKETIWNHKDNLMLDDLVNDIFTTSIEEIDEYIINKKIKEKDGLHDEKRNNNL